MVALSATIATPTSIVGLLNELDIQLPTGRTGTVVDHFNFDSISASEKHDVLVLDAPSNVRPGMKDYFEMPGTVIALPHAVGQALGASQLLTPVLRAPHTAYSYDPKEEGDHVEADDLFAAGQQLSLVTTMQARNTARVTVLGSAELLQDKWFTAHAKRQDGKKIRPNNRGYARRLSGWAFQETGVLRVNEIEHRLQGTNETNPQLYRIKNDVVSIQSFHFPMLFC